MRYFKKNNKYKYGDRQKDSGCLLYTSENKDGTTTSDINGAIRVLKKKLMKEGLFQELRERSFFQSRGEKNRRAKAAGKRRWQRKMEKRKQELGY